jgi:hypothetical protein
MPTYAIPGSDDVRLNTLETIVATNAADPALASLVPVSLLASIQGFLPQFRPAVQAVDAAMAGRAKEVSEKSAVLSQLHTHVRDFHEVLKRRTQRHQHAVAVLVHYGLPQSGDVPRLTTEDAVETTAHNLVEGETAATAAGFPPMANPSAAELAAVLASYRKESSEVSPADEKVRSAQLQAAALRARADELIADTKDEITHALRKHDAPGQRRVLRQFGFTYTNHPGETPEPAPAATPAS